MGFYTVWLPKFITNGRIHSFEPDAANFEKLQKNVALNNIQNIVITNNKAASNINGELFLLRALMERIT